MKDQSIPTHFFRFFVLLLSTASTAAKPQLPMTITSITTTTSSSSILFYTVDRTKYNFDIFILPITTSPQPVNQNHEEVKLTDGISVNYNGFFPSPTSSDSSSGLQVVYVTERHGSSNIYRDTLYVDDGTSGNDGEFKRRRSALEIVGARLQIPLLHPEDINGQISMKDRPSISGEFLVYISTHENPGQPRKSWTAVYSTHLKTRETQRLTPYGVADFSPSVSPSGTWTTVASSGEKGWQGEIEDLDTDIYIFKTQDGSDRVKVVEHGGWPCWMDEFTIYFHRESSDGWWSVYQATLPRRGTLETELITIKRVTPPGFHAFTPAASTGNKSIIAVATRRPTSDFRHIELYDLSTNNFIELTRLISPETHHYNPFISPDGSHIGYHKCRGGNSHLLLENMKHPDSEFSLLRMSGEFPSFSPDGNRIAYVGPPGLYVVNRDGSGKREILPDNAFSTAWDWKRKGVVYTSVGPSFATVRTHVDIVSVNVDEPDSDYKQLTTGGQNNAFPSASPDGRHVVFRSGRTGYKNLYIMDAIEGEKGKLERLTSGPWTDTMCNWSPDGEWIAFASDRDNPGSGSFAIYFIHPNGTGVKRVVHSGEGGRANHPWFSPDSKSFVFTSDYAGVSAEPISNPFSFQPYGDIFIATTDGSGLQRLTHNSYEDGSPTWSPALVKPVDVIEMPSSGGSCDFEDCRWLGGTPKGGVVASMKPVCV